MELLHRFTVPTPVTETWAAFNDLERVAPCFPGATLDSVEGDEFAGSVKVKLGPISLLYKGSGSFVERDESSWRAVIDAKGKDKRGNGTAAATIRAQLTPDGDHTAVDVTTDLSITGKPAQFGRGMIQDVSDKLLDQFVACLEENLGATVTPEPAPAPSGSGAEPSAPAAAPSALAGSAARSTESKGGRSAEVNLLATVGPVIVKRYAAPAIGVIVVVLLLRKVLRR